MTQLSLLLLLLLLLVNEPQLSPQMSGQDRSCLVQAADVAMTKKTKRQLQQGRC